MSKKHNWINCFNRGNRPHTDGQIDDHPPFSFLLDTGADCSCLPKYYEQYLNKSNIKKRKPQVVMTSGGRVKCKTAKIAVLRLMGGHVFRNVEFLILPQASGGDMVILGMDIIKHLEVRIVAGRMCYAVADGK